MVPKKAILDDIPEIASKEPTGRVEIARRSLRSLYRFALKGTNPGVS